MYGKGECIEKEINKRFIKKICNFLVTRFSKSFLIVVSWPKNFTVVILQARTDVATKNNFKLCIIFVKHADTLLQNITFILKIKKYFRKTWYKFD